MIIKMTCKIGIKRIVLLFIGVFLTATLQAEETPDSVDTFNNQTVTTEVTVQGRTVLSSQNVTVTSTGDLILNGPQGVVIPQNFEVALGGTLQLNGGLQYAVSFIYDASGNRIRRKKIY